MAYRKHIGIFAKTPRPGQVKTRLVPPLTAESACSLYESCVADLFRRVGKLKKMPVTVFYAGDEKPEFELPPRARLLEQAGESLGDRLQNAFSQLLTDTDHQAIIIGSDSPDIPLPYIRRAFQKLRHRDVVLGPTFDGGYWLIGLRNPQPSLFKDIPWSTSDVMAATLAQVQRAELSLSLLPMWYDVDDDASLSLLRTNVTAQRLAGGDRLLALEMYFDNQKDA
jgi:rSAM/selenodomain-associated transferase 1